jgi:uncharacterized protein
MPSTKGLVARSPTVFFLLVYALTIPFWVLSGMIKINGLPDNLPVTDAGATFVPLIAAMILIHREQGPSGIRNLLKRTFDFKRIHARIWYLPVIFLSPLLYVLTYGAMRLIGLPVPNNWQPPLATPLLFITFFIAAAGEELGYMGYAIDPIQGRIGALPTGLVVGSLWALWHFPSMIQIGQSSALMACGFLATVGFRILYIWLYNNTGRCVFGVILFHAMGNTGRSVFPGGRSTFELAHGVVGYSLVVISSIVVTFFWGAKTLATYRYGVLHAQRDV